MHNNLLPYNLQFFAEGGAEEPEVAAPVEDGTNDVGTETPEGETGAEEPAEEPQRDLERDSQYAAIRRKAEEDARRRYDAENANLNAEIKRLFGGFENPLTGKPIETMQDYLQAFEAQQKQQQDEELRSKGVDPALIERMVNNNPAIREAQAIIAKTQQDEVNRKLEADLKEVSKLDPSIQSLDDLAKHASYPQILQLVQNNGLDIQTAYKVANMDSLLSRQTDAVRQAAINQAKGKQHMVPTNGVAEPGADLAPIPDNQLAKWKQAYPNLSLEQLTQKYNSVM